MAVIREAIDAGYSLLDTAFNYDNEGAVGKAIRDSGVERSELIVASKLPGRHHDPAEAKASIEESRYRLGLDYLDLYLIHWPNPKQGQFVGAWEALIDARDKGLVSHIGVSNFLPEDVEELEARTGVRPEVNQLELHPRFPQPEILAWHASLGTVPLPRSTSPERLRENLASVDKQLSAEAVAAVNTLGAAPSRLWNQDPAEYEEF
ncbi:aldo/keto reductase [Corynebacterium sp. A21]|uniref:aldo/keto reductase n=1 Tax=Corynebacterium sp. A21 TaxID=3457318 RepID=UPI003FD629B1